MRTLRTSRCSSKYQISWKGKLVYGLSASLHSYISFLLWRSHRAAYAYLKYLLRFVARPAANLEYALSPSV